MPHVAVLAPMPLELDAVAVAFGLGPADDGGARTGVVGGWTVTAVRTGMGPDAARKVTAQVLDGPSPTAGEVDHVMVVGICGGLDPEIAVGTVLFPEEVVDHETGATYRHAPLGTTVRTGSLVTTREVHFDPDLSRRMLADGALGVDMESAAVAEVCEARGRPWSVHRCISDRWMDGLLDQRVVALIGPDGSVDLDGITRLLADEPELAPRLEQLGADTDLAARRAAEDAFRACVALGR